jgi:hypothetical protein
MSDRRRFLKGLTSIPLATVRYRPRWLGLRARPGPASFKSMSGGGNDSASLNIV